MKHETIASRSDLLFSVLIIIVLVLVSGGMGVYVLSDPGLNAGTVLLRAADAIERYHAEPVRRGAVIESGRQGMFDRLDRYSGYVDVSEYNWMQEELSGAYGGIGVTIVPHDGGLMLMSVRETGPAGKAGLLTGDVLIAADSVPFADLTPNQASSLLRGEAGTDVLVQVYRPVSQDTIEVTLVRERIPLQHVAWAGFSPGGAIYIRVLDFDAEASDQILEALDSLMNVPDGNPVGIILDLRGNPGGLFSEAYRTANLFLDQDAFIVGTDGRSRWNEETHFAVHGDMTDGLPMAVIVDNGSASAAEIVAGALQQADRAILVGDTTFGKGLVQGFIRLPEGDGLRLTVSRYYFDNAVYLNRFDSTLHDTGSGLAPDYYYYYPEQDLFLRRLESSLLLQEFAYGHLDEILALSDDPAAEIELLTRFREYAGAHDFPFESAVTEQARKLRDIVRRENGRPETQQQADRIVGAAVEYDRRLLLSYADYLVMRLRRIAYEREYGLARTYREVIVRERGDIHMAEELLRQRRS